MTRPETKFELGSRGIVAVVLSVGALIAAVGARVRVYPELPPLAGYFFVETTRWDEGLRPASGPSPDTGRCSITVQLWYPAEPETGVGPAPYDSGNEGFLSAKRWVKTGEKLDAAVAAAHARFPILLYLPEWDGVPTPSAARARDRAR